MPTATPDTKPLLPRAPLGDGAARQQFLVRVDLAEVAHAVAAAVKMRVLRAVDRLRGLLEEGAPS